MFNPYRFFRYHWIKYRRLVRDTENEHAAIREIKREYLKDADNFINMVDSIVYTYYPCLTTKPHELDPTAQLIAVRKDPWAIYYITNATDKAKMIAIKLNPSIIATIENPSEKMQKLAVSRHPVLIGCIKNPTVAVQHLAVTLNPQTIRLIKNPDPKVAFFVKMQE